MPQQRTRLSALARRFAKYLVFLKAVGYAVATVLLSTATLRTTRIESMESVALVLLAGAAITLARTVWLLIVEAQEQAERRNIRWIWTSPEDECRAETTVHSAPAVPRHEER